MAAQRRALAAVRDAAGEGAPSGLRARIALARVPEPPRARSPWPRAAAWASAVAAAAAAVVVLALAGGGPAAPTAADAAALALRPSTAGVAAPRGSGSVLPAPRAAGLPFPYWEDRFGWRATGFRRDDVGGRGATTIVYRRAGARIAYTIVAGDALRTGAATRRTVLRGTAVRAFRRDGREVVTWQRRGHTCVLSGAATSRDELLRLAAWTGGGGAALLRRPARERSRLLAGALRPRERPGDPLAEVRSRLEAQLGPGAARVQRAALKLPQARGLEDRLELLGTQARRVAQRVHHVEHGDLDLRADVVLARGLAVVGGEQVGAGDVADEDVVARLPAVAEDRRAAAARAALPQKIAMTPASPSGSWRGP